jgi:uncharacterized OB-fold protein
VFQRCRGCGHIFHSPLPVCPACRSRDYEWAKSSSRGTVYSRTVVEHSAHVAADGHTPYLVALVTLEEGPRMVSNILNCPMDEVRIGMPVTLTFQDTSAGGRAAAVRADARGLKRDPAQSSVGGNACLALGLTGDRQPGRELGLQDE